MNTRRKFLVQGSLASAALLAIKPFKTISGSSQLQSLTGFSVNENKVVVAHTSDVGNANVTHTQQVLSEMKSTTGNLLLLHAGHHAADKATRYTYDASMKNTKTAASASGSYQIVYKGNYKIGIITADCHESDLISKINRLSGYLKNERDCHLVVCLSQLGYKNNSSVDDRTLAEQSSNLDLIVGGQNDNHSKHPVIVLNKNSEEVIINHSAANNFYIGQIHLGFNDAGKKMNVSFC